MELERIRERLSDPTLADAEFGDHALNPAFSGFMRAAKLKPAAVLIAIRDRPDPQVILTHRSVALRAHSGQIAFPGGRIDDDDHDEIDAALREAHEEIALGRDDVSVIGTLPDYLTGSGYRIKPVVGLVSGDPPLVPNPAEVDRIFDVPLDFLFDAANHRKGSREFQGSTRYFYEMPYGEHYIWGVTAGVIRMFHDVVMA